MSGAISVIEIPSVKQNADNKAIAAAIHKAISPLINAIALLFPDNIITLSTNHIKQLKPIADNIAPNILTSKYLSAILYPINAHKDIIITRAEPYLRNAFLLAGVHWLRIFHSHPNKKQNTLSMTYFFDITIPLWNPCL